MDGQPYVPDTGTLTLLLGKFVSVFSLGFDRLGPESRWILSTMVTMEIVLSGLAWAAKGQDAHLGLAKKLLPIGFITLLVTTWKSVVTMVIGGFLWIGKTAGGGTSDFINDPSRIVDIGMDVCQPIIDFLNSYETWNPAKALIMGILLGGSMIGILASFFVIAINCFITYLEFYIVSVLTAIFVPFGVFKPTAFLSEKAIGAVIGQGVKLMVLAFIVAVSAPVIQSINLPAEPTIAQCWLTLLAVLAIAILAVHAPALAGGILSGSPSLSAGSAATTTLGAMAGMAAAGGGALIAGKAAAQGGAAAAHSASRVSGAVSAAGMEGAKQGAAMAQGVGGGRVGTVGAAVGGAVGNVAGMAISKAADAVKSGASQVGSGLKNSFAKGQNDASNFMPMKPLPSASAAAAASQAGTEGAAETVAPEAAAASAASEGASAGVGAAEAATNSSEAPAAAPAPAAAAPAPAPAAPAPAPAPAPARPPAPAAAPVPSNSTRGADNATADKKITSNAAKAVESMKGDGGGGGSMSPQLHHGEE
ncbi:P-type conjugative transfer protein TrbL (plasmid) [Dyella sp. BiH032]|uniref:P-type conjugative transfer protein TrbL n=1 Tax=Dyella sp. BiH032 TaxID=3075430 RepID=UPI002892C7F1|nr:P-type conjugative transfer protein TrbL [Dyella sp. BiH032]WNL48565.1 P-type conjugative transfer protein TrbL [Dyella sp. BiH032]